MGPFKSQQYCISAANYLNTHTNPTYITRNKPLSKYMGVDYMDQDFQLVLSETQT